jgi:hypothetical protein
MALNSVMEDVMRSLTPCILVGVVAAAPGIALAQSPKAATFITP